MKVNWAKVSRRGGIAAASVAVAVAGYAAPAFAGNSVQCPSQSQTDPNNTNQTPGDGVPGGACAVQGTITIPSQLSLYTNVTSFSLSVANGTISQTPAGVSGAGQFEIASNVSTGYYMDEMGPVNGFTQQGGTGAPLPNTDIETGQIQTGSPVSGSTCPASTWIPLPPGTFQTLSVTTASQSRNCNKVGGYTAVNPADDVFDFPGFALINFNGSAAGTYTGTVEFALWGT